MRKIKKGLGVILATLGAIRWLPDLLESAQATQKYGLWAYKHLGVLVVNVQRGGVGITAGLLLVGGGLIFSETIQQEIRTLRNRNRTASSGNSYRMKTESKTLPDYSVVFEGSLSRSVDPTQLQGARLIDRGSGAERKAAEENKFVKDSDPTIYVDIESRTIQGTRCTPLILHNSGKSIAHRIQVAPLALSLGTAIFKEVDYLGVDKKSDALPIIELAGTQYRNDLVNFLHHEANAKDMGSVREFVIPASLTYQDVNGTRKFRVFFDLMYSPLNKMMYENSGHQATILEVRNTRIAVISS